VTHGVGLYPAEITCFFDDRTLDAKGEDGFIECLEFVLSAPDTSRLLAGLMAQIRSADESEAEPD